MNTNTLQSTSTPPPEIGASGGFPLSKKKHPAIPPSGNACFPKATFARPYHSLQPIEVGYVIGRRRRRRRRSVSWGQRDGAFSFLSDSSKIGPVSTTSTRRNGNDFFSDHCRQNRWHLFHLNPFPLGGAEWQLFPLRQDLNRLHEWSLRENATVLLHQPIKLIGWCLFSIPPIRDGDWNWSKRRFSTF